MRRLTKMIRLVVALLLVLETKVTTSETLIPDIPNDIEKLELTSLERTYFNRFKAEVGTNFTKDYMNTDMYMIKWLRATRFDIPAAVEKIKVMLEWRKEYGMDNILEEDFSNLERLFPIMIDGHDYVGRPVGAASVNDWDLRKVILSGGKDHAIRFVYRLAELGVVKVMEAHAVFPNVSSGILLMNMAGFNKQQHFCEECIPIFRNMIVSIEKYFPFMLHKLIAINTPMSFFSIFKIFLPLIGRNTRDIMKIYGPDKRTWKPALLKLIPPDQLEPSFGGTKKSKFEE